MTGWVHPGYPGYPGYPGIGMGDIDGSVALGDPRKAV